MATTTARSILLVEDDLDMQLLVRLTLRPDPRLEVAAQSGSAKDALAALDEVDADLILLDHGLDGDVPGLRAAPMLKERAPAAKVLLYSALDLRYEARAEPAVDCFLRKDRIRELLTVIQRMLGLDDAEV